MLGNDLVSVLRTKRDVLALDRAACDITDADALRRVLGEWRPQVVINCAAYADVDGCEQNPEKAFAVNAQGAGNVARAAEAVGARAFYISTDYVFDGEQRTPYREDDPTHPINIYGQSKLEGEKLTLKNDGVRRGHRIIRTSWLYGMHRANFVEKVVTEAESRSEIEAVADQISCPTWTLDLARKLSELVETSEGGILHIVNGGGCSRYEFAQAIVERLARPVAVRPMTWSKLQRPAKRPAYSVMDCSGLERIGVSLLPSWQAALDQYLLLRQTHPVGARGR